MSIVQMSLSISQPLRTLSSSSTLCGPSHVSLFSKFSHLSLRSSSSLSLPIRTTTIRMGGGPRTYPGGVSKWQWKRMQAKKAKQLLKARLARERQIYEMRKRAELKAAVAELERPWEVVEKAPKLFSVQSDEQVKVLADRFQRPGGFDMWSEKDGPQIFSPVDGLPSARFFPKGVVHSIKPYGKIERKSLENSESCLPGSERENDESLRGGFVSGDDNVQPANSLDRNGNSKGRRFGKKGKRRRFGSKDLNNMDGLASGGGGSDVEQRGETLAPANVDRRSSRRHVRKLRGSSSEVYDLSLQKNGSYGFKAENLECD